MIVMPDPSVTGNEMVEILKHKMVDAYSDGKESFPAAVEVALRNISDETIATLIFEALFYDFEGNIIDDIKHKEYDIKPDYSRAFLINSSVNESGIVKSYSIKIKLLLTTDIEKVQLRARAIVTNREGEAEISGTAKNISNVKIDSALTAVIYDTEENIIGTKCVIFKDMDSGNVRKFNILFKPQEGTVIKDIVLFIGDVV
jgi:hypothetical protein